MRFKITGLSRSVRHNIILALLSVVFMLLMLELACRTILPTSDYPYSETTSLGLQRIPNQHGRTVKRMGEQINAAFSINAQGWNAPADYTDEPVIAVIGDSFIEALQVDIGSAFPDLLESDLAAQGCSGMTTYRFGVSGAPLSSYYVVMQHALSEYHPRVVVVNLVPNDFTESLEGYEPWGPVFWRVDPGTMKLVPPEDVEVSEYDRWRERNFALRRFVLFNFNLPVRDAAQRLTEYPVPPVAQTTAVTGWLMSQMQQLADEHSALLLFTMEGSTDALYGLSDNPLNAWQAEVEQIAAAHGISYLSLQPALSADYDAHHEPLHIAGDWHWNERGHQVVAGAVEAWLRANVCK